MPILVSISFKPYYIRGIDGNFAKLEQTIDVLLNIRKENLRLHVYLGTVISNYNFNHCDDIEDWVHRRRVESLKYMKKCLPK